MHLKILVNDLTLLISEWPKLYGLLDILSAVGLGGGDSTVTGLVQLKILVIDLITEWLDG